MVVGDGAARDRDSAAERGRNGQFSARGKSVEHGEH